MKDIYIADLAGFEEQRIFDGYFLLLTKQTRSTKTNKPYLSLILCDKTGQLEGRVWDPEDPRIAKDVNRGDIVKARGCVSRFDDRMQMKVEQIRRASAGEVDKADLMPATSTTWALWREMMELVESFTEPHLKLLLQTILRMRNSRRHTARRRRRGSCITHGWADCWSTW